jgi:general secretion pathway protein M
MMEKLTNLSQRERWALLAGGVVVLITLLYLGVIAPYRSSLEMLDSRINARQRQVKEVQAMRQEFLELQQRLQESEARLSKAQGFTLFSFMEGVAAQAASKEHLVYMRPQTPAVQGEVREESVEIKLEKIKLDQMVRLLHAIESAEAYLQVKNLRIRTRFDNRALLDVVLTVSSYGRNT